MAPQRKPNNTPALRALGIKRDDCATLRRLEKRLQRWHELECGTCHPAREDWTVCIERDEETGKPFKRTMGAGYGGQWFDYREPCIDDEARVRRALSWMEADYPHLVFFIQGDPRGCALHVIPREAVEAAEAKGQDASYIYSSRGVAVY